LYWITYSQLAHYIDYNLHSKETLCYKAAGILCYFFDNDNIYVLLKEEIRRKNIGLSFLAGKREHFESNALTTAIREFNEETSFLLSNESKKLMQSKIEEKTGGVIWYESCLCVLYLYYMNHDLNLSEKFNNAILNKSKDGVHWIKLKDIISCKNLILNNHNIKLFPFVYACFKELLLDSNSNCFSLIERLQLLHQGNITTALPFSNSLNNNLNEPYKLTSN